MSSQKRQKKQDIEFCEQFSSLQKKFKKHGQGHVFKCLDRLNLAQKKELYNSLEPIDLEEINKTYKRVILDEQNKSNETVTPFTGNVVELATVDETEKKRWYDKGLDLIAEGKVGILLMAGGQGTRLGSSEPKGCYNIGLPSGKSLFQLQAERIIKIRSLAHKSRTEPTHLQIVVDVIGAITSRMRSVRLPWYILTSAPTHDKTVAFFKKNEYFGLPESDVFFFQQGLSPCLTPEGKLILSSMTKLAIAPNGNGGLYTATKESGALRDMKWRGIEFLQCYGVDNVLVKVADPHCIGFMALEKSDCCNKVVLKEDPTERVGVMCLRNGKPGVVEYSEISQEDACLRNESGKLVYSAGNVAMHFFTLSFLEKIAMSPELPFHIAKKKIPYLDDAGQVINPQTPNGIKMEMFIFDVFYRAKQISCFAVQRENEFSPVKNKNGPPDAPIVGSSPDNARLALSDYHIRLISQNGGTVQPNPDRCANFEISPLLSYDGEDLSKYVNGKTYSQPFHLTKELGRVALGKY